MSQEIEKLTTILSKPKKIILVSHINPDGDAVGSLLGFSGYLTAKGHSVTVIVPNEVPRYLKGVVGVDCIREFHKESDDLKPLIADAEVIGCLDFNEIENRIGDLATYILANESANTILIDHHLGCEGAKFDFSYSNPHAAAASFLVAKLIIELSDTEYIDEQMAEQLYLGIMTDTGNFNYGDLTPELFRIVATLVEQGAKPVSIINKVFNVQSHTKMKLLGYCLYTKMRLIKHHRTAYITLTESELLNFNFRSGDAEGIVNYPLSLDGIDFSAIFIENRECIKVSLRSQGENAVDVNSFARKYFKGGGHRMAAGAKSFDTMSNTVEIFLAGVNNLYR